MPRTPTEAADHKAPHSTAVGSAVRVLTLAGAILTTGLVAGLFYAYSVSVNLGLADQPDAAYRWFEDPGKNAWRRPERV